MAKTEKGEGETFSFRLKSLFPPANNNILSIVLYEILLSSNSTYMARLDKIIIEGYRSIKHPVEIVFSRDMPIVLIGENNAGKSNIVNAIEILFGERWPGSQSLEDHDVWNRNIEQEVEIKAHVSGYENTASRGRPISGFKWTSMTGENKTDYQAIRSDNGQLTYSNNDLHNELTAIKVDAERNLSYQLSYTSKWTLLSKVMKAFHQKLVSDEERVQRLEELFEDIKDTFEEVDEFRGFSEEMSNLTDRMLSGLTYGLEMDFSAYDPSNYFRSLRVNPVEDGEVRNLDELGTGQQQVLALSFAHAYSKSLVGGDIILIIEEPESHLHPLAQQWLANTINEMASDGLQIILTTHSPYFVNLEALQGINIVRKSEEGTYIINSSAEELRDHCIETGVPAGRCTTETIVPFYANHATPDILNGLFAKKIILVEGPTEELALPVYFQALDFDTDREGIDIICVDGKGNLAKWWRFFTHYGIPTYICFDNDADNDGDERKRRDALQSIGIPDEDLEELLGVEDWNIGDRYCVFGNDFETTMRASFAKYEELEEEVKEELGNSKHIVARTVAKRLEVDVEDIGWLKIGEIVEKLKQL